MAFNILKKIKIPKKLKKLIYGILSTTITVSLILVFGSTQSDITDQVSTGKESLIENIKIEASSAINRSIKAARPGAESLENIFYDLFFKKLTYREPVEGGAVKKVSTATSYDPNILIVDVDEPSLDKLGSYYEWDRSIHANVVKNLSNGGASAISFDILFKNADFGKQKTNQVVNVLKSIYPDSTWDTQASTIQSGFNYDSLLVQEIKDDGNVIVCSMFDDRKSYKHESQWAPLSSEERADSIGYSSTFEYSQADKPQNIEPKDLLDNIFPKLANAGRFMGSVNAYPDDDGVVRNVAMLYRFPNPELYENIPSKIYSTMSLMTVLHLFHQKPSNVQIKMGKYIDIGKPFGIYREMDGSYHVTYPQFSYPMFLSLREKLINIHKTKKLNDEFVDVSTSIIAINSKDDGLIFEIKVGDEYQTLTSKLSNTLLKLDTTIFHKIPNGKSLKLGEGIELSSDTEIEGAYLLRDEEEDEEAKITPFALNTINFFKDSLENIPVGKQKHLSLNLDLRYDKEKKQWNTQFMVLTKKVLDDIRLTPDKAIADLKPGEELRFGENKRIPINKYGRYQVNYKGRYNTDEVNRVFQHISYYDVTKNRIDPAFYQGKIFILGSAAAALFDFKPGPHEENNPAVLIHATIIKNILEDDYLTTLEENYQRIIVIILAIICMLLGLYLKSYLSLGISMLLISIYGIVAYHYFEMGLYIGVSKQVLAILLTNIVALVVQFYFENKEKRFLDNAFKQYISPELINEMVKNEVMPELGGNKSNITAYFTDIASFSTFSEKIGDPTKLVELLNEYLTAMTDTLLENKGTLDKYEGDAIIAFFGAPMPLKNHAQSACDTAIDMQNKLMGLRQKWVHEQGKWPTVVHDMHMRIGINSGDIVTGNMGSTMRKNYTMMGDAVNLAARLESAAKQYGAYIQISEDTQKHLEEGKYIYRSLDTIRVIGKSLPVKTFELLQRADCADKDNLNKLVEIWELAREAYLAMEWNRAIELFTQCLDFEPHLPSRDPGSKTCPSLIYIKRCEAYKKNPPVEAGETWDGIFTATEK